MTTASQYRTTTAPAVSISVILCSHDPTRRPKLDAAIEAVHGQTVPAHEVVFVADGSPVLAEAIKDAYPEVTVVPLEENEGLTTARNVGASVATGDVVAFLDDDAIPSPHWLAELTRLYTAHDAVAAGGHLDATLDDRPLYLPREFDWLVGGTHRGYTTSDGREPREVRNTFGSNLSFRRDVFTDLGGFDEDAGMNDGGLQQAAETMLCARLHRETGDRVWYSPDAIVEHDINPEKTRFPYLLRRAFWQGYSKATMQRRIPDTDDEADYLTMLLRDALPRRVIEAIAIPLYTGAVALGFAWNHLEDRLP